MKTEPAVLTSIWLTLTVIMAFQSSAAWYAAAVISVVLFSVFLGYWLGATTEKWEDF